MFALQTICALLLSVTLATCQDASDTHVTGPDDGGPGDTTIHLNRPRRITQDDIARWGDMLDLSDEQRVYFESLHATYLLTDTDLRRELYVPLWEQAKTLGAVFDQAIHNLAVAEQIATLGDDTEDANGRLLASEEVALFQPLIPVLTEEQVSLLPRVRARRKRDAHRDVHPVLRSARVDLISAMESLQEDEQWVVTDEPACRALLEAYEVSLNAGWRVLYERYFDRFKYWDHGRLTGREAGMARALRASASAETNIVRLNETYLALLKEHVAPETADALERRYRQAAYPQFYPNPYGLEEAFTIALGVADLTDTQLDGILVIRDTYHQRDDAIVKGMIAEV